MKSKVLSEVFAFDRAFSKETWRTYKRIVCRLCLDHPDQAWSKLIPGYLRSKQILPLLELADSLVAQEHATARETFLAHQIAAVIRKYPFPKTQGLNPELTARETWIDGEQKCSFVNSRFEQPFWGSFFEEYERMRNFLRYALSDTVPLRKIYSLCDIGPGASLGTHGNATNLARKFGGVWSVTSTARDYAYAAFSDNWHLTELLCKNADHPTCIDPKEIRNLFEGRISTVTHNKVTFVPKTAKTLRSIAVEPLFNSFLQKGVDQVLRLRLKRLGIDLSNQGINSELARKGSLSDDEESFVTLDLSSASDSISTNLCKQLLPPNWFDFLNQIRSRQYELDGILYDYQKFCSMGNGFCFPLETLLFTAACHAVGCGQTMDDYHVYGDDIIIRKKHASKLIALLEDMGFEVNSKKSYTSGKFRESCGSDWYNGDDVRPITFDKELDSLQSLFKLWNLSRRSWRTYAFFSGVRELILSWIPTSLQFMRPFDGNADSAMTTEKDRFMSSKYAKWSKDHQAWMWVEVVSTPYPDKGWRAIQRSEQLLMIAALRGSSSKEPFVIRRKTHKAIRKVSYSSVSTWIPGEKWRACSLPLPFPVDAW